MQLYGNNKSSFNHVEFTQKISHQVSWNFFRFQAETVSGITHTGTHLDAPYHSNKNRWSVTQIPTARLLFSPIVLLDITAEATRNASYQLVPSDVQEWEKNHGLVPQGSLFILRTGWYKVSIILRQILSILRQTSACNRRAAYIPKV